jgi:hypothetical protein
MIHEIILSWKRPLIELELEVSTPAFRLEVSIENVQHTGCCDGYVVHVYAVVFKVNFCFLYLIQISNLLTVRNSSLVNEPRLKVPSEPNTSYKRP